MTPGYAAMIYKCPFLRRSLDFFAETAHNGVVASDPANGVNCGHALAGGLGWIVGDVLQELVIWLALLAILVAVAIHCITKIRPHSAQQEHDTHELMAKFRELHSQGGLSDEEYRTIKNTFTEQLRQGVNQDDGEG